MSKRTAGSTPRPSFAIDGFEPIERLGAGGFGVVWKARQDRIGRLVAIKVSTTVLETEEEQRFFDRECESLGRLSGHPNIVQVHTTGHLEDGRPYLVLEYVGGGTLTKRIKQGSSSEAEVIELGIDLCKGLLQAHRAGVLHRDIKPDNVFLRGDGTAVLGDFGIAQLIDSTKSHGTAVIGSLRYIAPEVLKGEVPTVVSDLYGVGITLHTMMTRVPPFTGKSNMVDQIIKRVITDQPEQVASHGFSEGLDHLVATLLDKAPENRPASAAHVLKTLMKLSEQAKAEPSDDSVNASGSTTPKIVGLPTEPAITEADNHQNDTATSASTSTTTIFDSQAQNTDTAGKRATVGPGGTRVFSVDPVVKPAAIEAHKNYSVATDDETAAPSTGRVETTQTSVVFEGQEYSTPKSLAAALAVNWDAALWDLSGQRSRVFIEELAKAAFAWNEPEVPRLVSKFAPADARRRHQLLTELLIELDPDQQPTYRGWAIGNSERSTTAVEMPPLIVDEIRRGEILVRWRRNQDMTSIVSTAHRWEQSIQEYDRRNVVLQVNDPLAGGKLLSAAGDTGAVSNLRKALITDSNHSAAGRQAWWAELFSSNTAAGLILARATIETAANQTAMLASQEQAIARRRSRRSTITAAVALATLAISGIAAYQWHQVTGPTVERFTTPWLGVAALPFLVFWYLLASSHKRGVVRGGCLGALGWLVYSAVLISVGGLVAFEPRLAPESSAFGLFLTIAVVSVPLVTFLTYRRLTSRLKSRHTGDTAMNLST